MNKIDQIKINFHKTMNKSILFIFCIVGVFCMIYFNINIQNKVKPQGGFKFSNEHGNSVSVMTVSVVNTYYHNQSHFTQGLEIVDGFLYEGTGLNGESALMKKDLFSGKIIQYLHIDYDYFGEGITIFNNKIYQLTWQSKIGFIYEKNSFKKIGSWNYNYEGWGITHDDQYLIVSDGTSLIRFLDPNGNLTNPVKTITVKKRETQIRHLNELEYIEGYIWANVWMTHEIVVIDPNNGQVRAIINLKNIRKTSEGDVLNGIAYNKDTDKLYVTGKKWKNLFEIVLIRQKKNEKKSKIENC